MSDPATTRASLHKVLGIVAATDLVSGIVLAVIGLMQDIDVLAIIGTVLLLSGGGMLAFVILQRNKPTAL